MMIRNVIFSVCVVCACAMALKDFHWVHARVELGAEDARSLWGGGGGGGQVCGDSQSGSCCSTNVSSGCSGFTYGKPCGGYACGYKCAASSSWFPDPDNANNAIGSKSPCSNAKQLTCKRYTWYGIPSCGCFTPFVAAGCAPSCIADGAYCGPF